MLQLLLKVTEFAASRSGELVYNIRDLSVLPLGFVVPDSCEAWLDLHLPPNYMIDVLKSELEQVVKECSAANPPLEAELRFEEVHAGYKISPERPVVKALKGVYDSLSRPWQPTDFRSHSDANTLWAAGVDPIILGPGRLEEAHTPEECVAFPQVVDAARIYLKLASSLPSA
jgi:acetylornithine deacetylase